MSDDSPFLLDVTRLIWRRWKGRLPTGIDRVCLAYLRYFAPNAQAVVQRDGFRRILDSKASQELFGLLDDPSGSFVLHRKAERAAVLLAGGIGITPFLSMIRQAAYEQAAHQIYLFYSNRRPEDCPFLEVLAETAKQNPRFHLIATMTKMKDSHRDWTGETGFVSKEMLRKHLPAIQGPIFYLAGPPAMVAAMRSILAAAQVDEDDIRTEEFSGY